jgi:hypothetical protein
MLLEAPASLTPASYALGSCLAGPAFGLLNPRGTAPGRFRPGIASMAVSMIPPPLVGNLRMPAVALFSAGPATAPTMVTAMGLVERPVRPAEPAEGVTRARGPPPTGLTAKVAVGPRSPVG